MPHTIPDKCELCDAQLTPECTISVGVRAAGAPRMNYLCLLCAHRVRASLEGFLAKLPLDHSEISHDLMAPVRR